MKAAQPPSGEQEAHRLPPRASGRLRILIITQLFPPEMGAQSNRMAPLVEHLAAAGHQVTVATGLPNYPTGRVFDGYRRRLSVTERLSGATVHRTAYLCVPRNKSRIGQLLSYLSFIPAALLGALRAGPVDVVMVTSPPLFPVVAGLVTAAVRRARLVVDIRDIWPDELVAVGAASPGSAVVKALARLEALAYRRADLVTCASPAYVPVVAQRGAGDRAVELRNGADLNLFRPVEADRDELTRAGVTEPFIVMYSGLLGMKHGLDALLDAATALRDRTDIGFVLVGDGADRARLEERAAQRELTNVHFLGERPVERLAGLLCAADVCVATLRPDPRLDRIVSVKLYEYMACARPVLAAVAGEGARVIEEARAGLVVPPGDAPALADGILALASLDPSERIAMGRRGHRDVVDHHSRQAVSIRFAGMLADLVARRRGGAA